VVERLGVAGHRRPQLRQLHRRRLQVEAPLDPLEHASRLPQLADLIDVDQPGQRPVRGQLREPGLEPALRAQKRLFSRTDGGFAFVVQPLPLGRAVLERRSGQLEKPGEAVPGGLADGLVDVGQAHREHADALGPVLAGHLDDRPAFRVVGRLDRDRAAEVAAGPLERTAGRVEEAPVLGAGVPGQNIRSFRLSGFSVTGFSVTGFSVTGFRIPDIRVPGGVLVRHPVGPRLRYGASSGCVSGFVRLRCCWVFGAVGSSLPLGLQCRWVFSAVEFLAWCVSGARVARLWREACLLRS
jgi:hypothetical protein